MELPNIIISVGNVCRTRQKPVTDGWLHVQIERLQRDTDPYTSYAMTSLTTTIGSAVPVILQKVCT